jgi:hypothetical protein
MRLEAFFLMTVFLLALASPVWAQEQTTRRAAPIESIAPLGNAGASPRACTQMWCQEGYMLNLEAQSWPQGYYNFKIIADENVYSCEGNLPLRAGGMPSIVCNDKGVQIGESGCALPADAHSFYAVTLSRIPENIVVSVSGPTGSFTHEGKVAKKCGYPNGEGCDPRPCCSASETVRINW